ncbi:IST1-like protein [Linum grandiflorum]
MSYKNRLPTMLLAREALYCNLTFQFGRSNSLIKMTNDRLEVSRKKKKTVAKYLKNDIADLLRTGFDINAYSRAQGLILEHNLIAAYKLMEDFCNCVATNLAVLDKKRECPNECREAIQSLMYAAARLAEFPELRDLRSLFSHRYGGCLELYINKEFRELLNPRPATKEMKLQLLGDVAQEFSIDWDPKFLEDKLCRPPPHASQQNQNRHMGSNNPEDCDHKTTKSKDDAASLSTRNKYKSQMNGKRDGASTENSLGTSEAEVPSPTRKNCNDEKHELHGSSGSETTDRDSSEPSTSSMESTSTASEDEVDNSKKIPYRFLPPPYVRTSLDKQDVKDQGSPKSTFPDTGESGSESQLQTRSVRRRQQMNAIIGGDENAASVGIPLKPPPGRGSLDTSSGMIFERSNKGSIWKESDDEEQYRKKRAEYERNHMRSKLKPLSWRSKDESGKQELEHGGDQGSSSNSGTGTHARSLSADSKVSGHVHPNLPDYDSLAARIAAFKGK